MKSHFRYSRARRRWLHTSRQCGIKRTRLETQPIRLGREVNRLSSANVHRLLAWAGAPFRAGHVHYMSNVFNDAARRLCELAARHALQDGRAHCAGLRWTGTRSVCADRYVQCLPSMEEIG
jgi:hypothetical protein